jgi:acetylornithine deacetylase/succinyl-diaminopimelate desuccinylase-like protein
VASYDIGGVGGHSADERINVEDVILTTKVYALVMLDLLGTK